MAISAILVGWTHRVQLNTSTIIEPLKNIVLQHLIERNIIRLLKILAQHRKIGIDMTNSNETFISNLFQELFNADTEEDVTQVLQKHPDIFHQGNWHPYGNDESFYGVIENQQASPIPALGEKDYKLH